MIKHKPFQILVKTTAVERIPLIHAISLVIFAILQVLHIGEFSLYVSVYFTSVSPEEPRSCSWHPEGGLSRSGTTPEV